MAGGPGGPLTRRDAIFCALIEVKHPTQWDVLQRVSEQPLSPTQLTSSRGDLGRVAYHVRQLVKRDLIEAVSSRPKRGTTETFYEPTAKGRELLDQLLGNDASS